jgi:hypothetical protein
VTGDYSPQGIAGLPRDGQHRIWPADAKPRRELVFGGAGPVGVMIGWAGRLLVPLVQEVARGGGELAAVGPWAITPSSTSSSLSGSAARGAHELGAAAYAIKAAHAAAPEGDSDAAG